VATAMAATARHEPKPPRTVASSSAANAASTAGVSIAFANDHSVP
jgi:hypothetical protein